MPLMQMPQSRVNTFAVGAYDQESGRNNLVFAWASSVEMGGNANSWHRSYLMNGDSHGMTLDTSTGAITWDTSGKQKGYYNIGVKVTDQSNSWSLVDFIVEVTDPIENFCSAACPIVAGASCAGATSTYDPCASSFCSSIGAISSCTVDSESSLGRGWEVEERQEKEGGGGEEEREEERGGGGGGGGTAAAEHFSSFMGLTLSFLPRQPHPRSQPFPASSCRQTSDSRCCSPWSLQTQTRIHMS